MRFNKTVAELGCLDRQLHIYEFIKAWWVKPDDNALITMEGIKNRITFSCER